MAEIIYNVKLADLLAFSEFDWRRSEKVRSSLRRHKTMWPAVFLAIGIFFLIVAGRADTTLRFGLLALTWAVLVPWLVGRYFRWRCVKACASPEWQRLIGQHRIKLDDAELMTTAPDEQKTRILRNELESVESTETHYFLYLKSDQALLIPKDSVKPRQLEKFIEKIRSRMLRDPDDIPVEDSESGSMT